MKGTIAWAFLSIIAWIIVIWAFTQVIQIQF